MPSLRPLLGSSWALGIPRLLSLLCGAVYTGLDVGLLAALGTGDTFAEVFWDLSAFLEFSVRLLSLLICLLSGLGLYEPC